MVKKFIKLIEEISLINDLMIKKFLFYCLIGLPILIDAQNNPFKNYVDTLTSLSFFGRGYVNEGYLHAAKYIKEFENLGPKPINGFMSNFINKRKYFP